MARGLPFGRACKAPCSTSAASCTSSCTLVKDIWSTHRDWRSKDACDGASSSGNLCGFVYPFKELTQSSMPSNSVNCLIVVILHLSPYEINGSVKETHVGLHPREIAPSSSYPS